MIVGSDFCDFCLEGESEFVDLVSDCVWVGLLFCRGRVGGLLWRLD